MEQPSVHPIWISGFAAQAQPLSLPFPAAFFSSSIHPSHIPNPQSAINNPHRLLFVPPSFRGTYTLSLASYPFSPNPFSPDYLIPSPLFSPY